MGCRCRWPRSSSLAYRRGGAVKEGVGGFFVWGWVICRVVLEYVDV